MDFFCYFENVGRNDVLRYSFALGAIIETDQLRKTIIPDLILERTKDPTHLKNGAN